MKKLSTAENYIKGLVSINMSHQYPLINAILQVGISLNGKVEKNRNNYITISKAASMKA